MADDDWLSAANEPEPEPAPAPAAAASAVSVTESLVESSSVSTIRKAHQEKTEGSAVYKVWKRPVFQQYSYLYDYRHNYYDDVIDYLNLRQRGFNLEIPRPQTWAERALRTYTRNARSTAAFEKRASDIHLLSDIRTSARFYNFHNKEYSSQRYSKYFL